MTGPERDDDPVEESSDEPSVPDVMASLVKRSLAKPEVRHDPTFLRGVQRRLRARSRGKFFADGWSTSEGRVSPLSIAVAMLLLVVLAYFALGPIAIQ